MPKDNLHSPGQGPKKPEYRKYLDEAFKLFRQGNYQDGERVATQAIEFDPTNPIGYSLRAGFYHALGRLDEALADCTKSIELDKTPIMGYAQRAKVYTELDQLENAVADYTKAIELSQKDSSKLIRNIKEFQARRYSDRGALYLEMGQIDKALNDYNKALELPSPAKRDIYWGRAELYHKMGRLDDALADYNAAIRADPKNLESYLRLADFFEQTGQTNEALLNYERATEKQPDDFLPYLLRAKLYEKTGKPDKALIDYNKAVELEPDAPGSYSERAEFYQRQGGKLDLALPDARKAVELNPGWMGGFFLLGSILLEQKNYPEAAKVFENARRCKFHRGQQKPLMEFYYTWAKGLAAYYQEDDPNKALALFSQAKQYSGKLLDLKKDDERFINIFYLIDAYIELIPKDNRLKKILGEPDKLSQRTAELDGLRESFSGMFKLSDGLLVEIDTLVETKRDICALLLPLDHPQSVKPAGSAEKLGEIEEALNFLKYEHTGELMRILRENRRKLESSQSFTAELSKAGSMADGALTLTSSSPLISTISVENLSRKLVEEEIEETITDPRTGASIKRRRKYQYTTPSPLPDDRSIFIESARRQALPRPGTITVDIARLIKTLREQAGIKTPLTPPEVSVHFIDSLYRAVRIETKIDQWVVAGNPAYRIVEDLGFPPLQAKQKVSTAYLVELANRGNLKASPSANKTERRLEQNRLATAIKRLNRKLKELFGLETDPVVYTADGYKSLFELIPYTAPEND